MDSPILAFKAGRAFRRGSTNLVDPNPAKGAIYVYQEDALIHLAWKNRETNEVEEDLMMFPEDATFSKVDQNPASRIYILKFNSSDDRHFFWMQDGSSTRDEEFAKNVNALLADPTSSLVWSSEGHTTSSGIASTSATAITVAGAAAPSVSHATPEQLTHLQSLVNSMTANNTSTNPPDLSLTDVVNPSNIASLFTSHPELIPAIFPHLPPDLPANPSAEVLLRIINSSQFRLAVAQFDQALRTGLLGGLVRGLGLPEEAGTSIEAFLRAVQEQARGSSDDRTQTD